MLFESLSILCVYNNSRISFYTLILAFRFLHRSHFVLPIIDRYVLHRIIQKRGSRYLMQGDGVCRFYEECEDTDIIGVVRRVCRPSGKKIETDSACWRLESRLWLGLGGCRGMVLRVLNRLGCWLLF